MEQANRIDTRAQATNNASGGSSFNLAALKPKGACWYCNQPLDNVRRFCSKACADDYRTEEEVFDHPE